MRCRKCGAKVLKGSIYCINCGSKVKKSKFRKLFFCIIITGLFTVAGYNYRNHIYCAFYEYKYNKCNDAEGRVMYAEKAYTFVNNAETRKMIDESLENLSKEDYKASLEKLDKLKDNLSMKEYKKPSIDIKNQEIISLSSSKNYYKALDTFKELGQLGEDYRENEKYDEVMLNIVADTFDQSVQDTKDKLIKENNICYGKFNNASMYDDIIEIKYYGQNENIKSKINLYSYDNGQYKLSDSKELNGHFNAAIDGINICDKINDERESGLYINCKSSDSHVTYVIKSENSKINLIGTDV